MKIEDIVKFIREETGCTTCVHREFRTEKNTYDAIAWCKKKNVPAENGPKCREWIISVYSSDVDLEVEATYIQSLSVKRGDNV